MHGLAASAMCAATILCCDEAMAQCTFISAAGMPLSVCASQPGKSFGLSAGGQRAVLALPTKGGTSSILSMDFDGGDYLGPFMVELSSDLNLSRDNGRTRTV